VTDNRLNCLVLDSPLASPTPHPAKQQVGNYSFKPALRIKDDRSLALPFRIFMLLRDENIVTNSRDKLLKKYTAESG